MSITFTKLLSDCLVAMGDETAATWDRTDTIWPWAIEAMLAFPILRPMTDDHTNGTALVYSPPPDALTADDLETGAPIVETSIIGQVHVLGGANTETGTPVMELPAIGQVHTLAASGLTAGTPSMESPTLAESGGEDNLSAEGVTSGAPVLAIPSIGQVHALVAAELTSGTPILDTPSISQMHALIADGITTGAVSIADATLGQMHVLNASGITAGSPILESPILAEGGDNQTPIILLEGIFIGLWKGHERKMIKP